MILAAALLNLVLAQVPARPLLDVPFVSQTPELCGGAAVSMVLRYWGQRDVFPQDFAPLVSKNDNGILTGVLASAVRDRGWQALVKPADAGTAESRIRAEIDRGRPIIALIEVAPALHHYVVIVGATANEVVFHDPARAPFRVLDWMAFDREWSGAGRWMMVALPPASAPAGATARLTPVAVPAGATARLSSATVPPAAVAAPAASPTVSTTTPCSPLVAHAVETAVAGQTDEAEQELAAARRLCPADAAAWRETAGLRFTQKRWAEANQFATTAARLAPADAYSWEMAGTSRFLMSDTTGALAAWNRIGEPRVDAINVHGADRTHVPVIVRAASLPPRALITPDTFLRSLRRVQEIPSIATADIKVEPIAGGRATVDVSVVEKAPYPRGRNSYLMLAARPALQREFRLDLNGLSGEGESVFAAWRYVPRRQRVAAGLAFPSPRWLPGVTSFSAVWEEQNYATLPGGAGPLYRETERRAGLDLADWTTGWLKCKAGAALDRFNDTGYAVINGQLHVRLPGDLVALTASATNWSPLSEGQRFSTTGVRAAFRSSKDFRRPVFSGAAGFQYATDAAPLAAWPSGGSGAGTERAVTLRGHQLVEDGIVKGDVLGRRLTNGTIEYSQPVGTVHAMNVAVVGFVDAAHATLPRVGFVTPPTYVDGGIGVRVRLPGSIGGVRLDIAHRLGDGRLIFSAGWIAAWPQ